MSKQFTVRVRRDATDGGRLVCEVNKTGEKLGWYVVDCQGHSRFMRKDTLLSRARSLAQLLDAEYEENLEIMCLATQKLKCQCPKCSDF